jgi:hypothetical protein
MNTNHSRLDSSQVLAALCNETPAPLSAEQQALLLARIESSAAALGAAAAAGSSIAGNHVAPVAAKSPISIVDRLSAQLAAHPVTTLATTLALGAALGVATYASVSPRHQQATHAVVAAEQTAIPNAPPAASLATQVTPISIQELPPVVPPSQTLRERPLVSAHGTGALSQPVQAAPAIASAQSPGLAEQLALLETARNAIAQKNPAAALRALESHLAQFPRSALTEEREALTIRALVLANRVTEAKRYLAQFETQFPNSLLLPALKRTVGNS